MKIGFLLFLLITVLLGFPVRSILAATDERAILQADFLKGKYPWVMARSGQLLAHASARQEELLLYLQGASALKLKEWHTAESALRKLLEDYPSGDWFILGSLVLTEVYAGKEDYPKALAVLEQAVRDRRAGAMLPQLNLRMGQIRCSMGMWKEAKDSFQSVLRQAPRSLAAAQAKRLLEQEDFAFCVQVGAFKTKSNALRLKHELTQRGYPVQVSEIEREGRKFYRVRVGSYLTRQEAQEEAGRLGEAGFPGKVVP